MNDNGKTSPHLEKVIGREAKMEMEMEYKIDIPPNSNPEETIGSIDSFLEDQEDIHIIKRSDRTREFTYFDTQNRDIQRNGWTLRCVGGFDPENDDGRDNFRYDYKIGEIGTPKRKEGSFWDNEKLQAEEVVDRFNLSSIFNDRKIDIAANAKTRHIKRTLQIDGTKIEITLDRFVLDNGNQFQELEIELEKGDVKVLDRLRNKLRTIFPESEYPEVKKQKYDRVLKLTGTL